MKKTILFIAFFLLPFSVFAQTGNKTIDGIFKTVNDVVETMHQIQKVVGQVPIARIYVSNMDPVALIGVECMGQRDFSDTSNVEGLKPGQTKTFIIPLYRENQQEVITVKFYEYDPLQKAYVFRGNSRSQIFSFSAYNPHDQNWDVRR